MRQALSYIKNNPIKLIILLILVVLALKQFKVIFRGHKERCHKTHIHNIKVKKGGIIVLGDNTKFPEGFDPSKHTDKSLFQASDDTSQGIQIDTIIYEGYEDYIRDSVRADSSVRFDLQRR